MPGNINNERLKYIEDELNLLHKDTDVHTEKWILVES